MNIIIRNEEEKDYRKVEEIARDAFWNLYFPGGHEHAIVNKIRNHEDFIKGLTFVIEVDGEVQGAIFYTHSHIVNKDGTQIPTISFGPVFISPEHHRQGLGRKLISYSIERAKEKGHRAILTLGYPYHYEPYGFMGGINYRISQSDGKFYKGLLVLPLFKDSLIDADGYVVFSEGLEITEDEVNEFDKGFPEREKKFQDSQTEFEKACRAIEE